MNISFRTPSSYLEVKNLVDFLWSQNLGYPNYDDWVLRAKSEIDGGYKTAILAFDEGRIVGNVIYQPHKELAGIREIKNLRVSTEIRCRKFGSFLLRQAEWVDFEAYNALMLDFRELEVEVEKMVISEGFQIVSSKRLYDDEIDKIAVKMNRFGRVSTLASQPSSKDGTPKGVAGSNPVPSAFLC